MMPLYQTKEIDLHYMSVIEARKYLKTIINSLDTNTKELRVIHGYKRGNDLQKMVRKEFKHKRVTRKILELNQGVTILMLG